MITRAHLGPLLAAAVVAAGRDAALAAPDAFATVSAHGVVAGVFSIAALDDIDLGSIPADGVSYSESRPGRFTLLNNESAPWRLKMNISAEVPGAALEAMDGDVTDFRPLPAAAQTFKSAAGPAINTPTGDLHTFLYRARTGGAVASGRMLAWEVVCVLTQDL